MGFILRLVLPIFRFLAPYLVQQMLAWILAWPERRREAKKKETPNESDREIDEKFRNIDDDVRVDLGNVFLRKHGSSGSQGEEK